MKAVEYVESDICLFQYLPLSKMLRRGFAFQT